MSLITKEHIWEYYINLTDFKAQCKYCEFKYNYINDTNFKRHIEKNHKKILEYEEERKLRKWPWMYFKYSDQLLSQCIICYANILSTSKSADLEDHLSSHSKEQRKNHILQNWKRKYWTQRNDFEVECNICHSKFSLSIENHLDFHIKKTHSDKLKNMQETHDLVDSSERVSSLETNVTFMPLDIATKKHIWEYYINLTDFKAQCKYCEIKYIYINDTKFKHHIRIFHKKILEFEEEKKLIKGPWMYFKYSDQLLSQCIICDADILSTSKSEDLENHLNSHSEEQRKNHIFQNWKRKYWTQRNDFAVECNICNNNISLDIVKNLNFHIRNRHSDKLKIMQETHDSVDSSERVSSLKTKVISMPLNIATKKHIWEYYIKLTDFRAQCKFCDSEYYYAKGRSFKRHIEKVHEKIWNHEEERKLKKWPWMYFKYSDQSFLQCIICNENYPSTSKSEDLEDHLNFHSKEQRKNHILQSWKQKYWTQRNDFEVECDICNNNISLQIRKHLDFHIRKTHSDKLKNMQETHDLVDSSERVSSLETNVTFMPLDIATKKHIWEYYIKLSDFEAQCKYCENKYNYIDNGNFIRHIAKLHEEIWKYEEGGKLRKRPWMYFKYSNQLFSQCIICDSKVLSTSKFVGDHLNLHSKEQQNNHTFRSWTEKYWIQRNDFVVECNICHDNLPLSIQKCLNSHIKETHSDKLKNVQETHDPVGSSDRISSHKTDTTFMSLKDCYVLLKRCPPYNLYI